MKPFSKRVLSALLAACMASATVPATAMAATLTIQDSPGLVTAAANKSTPVITLTDTTVWYGDPVAVNTSVKLGSTTTTNYNDEAGAIAYTYVDSKNITQSGTPKDAGTYTVIASVPGNDNYNSATSNKATLTIKASVEEISIGTISDIPYHGAAVTADDLRSYVDVKQSDKKSYTGDINYMTCAEGSENYGYYLPTDAGTYSIQAETPASETKGATTATVSKPATLNITKASTEIVLPPMEDNTDDGNEDYNPSYKYAYTGSPVNFQAKAYLNKGDTKYQVDISDKISYSYASVVAGSPTLKGLPKDKGEYVVTMNVAGTDNYESKTAMVNVTICEPVVSFNIAANQTYTREFTGQAITLPDVKATLSGTIDLTDKIIYSYRKDGSNTQYKGLPTDVGTYTVTATIPKTSTYDEVSATCTVIVKPANVRITMPLQTSFPYTGKEIAYKATATTGSVSISGIHYAYKTAGAANTDYTDGLPTKVGSYTIKAFLEGSTNYTSESKTANITITKAKPTITFADKTATYNGKPVGMTAEVKQLENDNYTSTLTYSYKAQGASDSSYTTVTESKPFPTDAGTYTVRVRADIAGGQYETVTQTATLTIKPIELDLKWTTDCADGCIHDGKVHTATPSIVSTSKILAADKDKVSVTAKDGSQTKAGTYKVTAVFTGSAAANYAATSSTATYSFVISEHEHVCKTVTQPATLTKDGSTVTKCTLPDCDYVKTSETIAKPDTIAPAKTSYVYSGKSKSPTVKIYDTDGERIASSNYTISYPHGRKVIGTHIAEITFTGEKYIGTMSTEFVITPPASSIRSLKVGKTYITPTFKPVTGSVSGYEIQYATKSGFSNAESVKVSKSKTSKMLKGLKSNQKYYVRVRSYKTVNGKTYCSAWSKVKNITTRKK